MESKIDNEWGEQDVNGVDLGLLRYNLTLTIDQRLEQHESGLRLMIDLQKAAENARLSGTSKGT